MDNPTDNAQVQDAEAKAREIEECFQYMYTDGGGLDGESVIDAIAQALREAERRGMMRAIEKIATVEKDMAGEADITAEQNTFRYGAGYALGRVAREIDRATGEG